MKRTIILIAVIIIALIAAVPVLAQGGGDDAYPISTPDPSQPRATPTEPPEPISIGAPPPPGMPPTTSIHQHPLIIVWFRQLVKWVESIFE